MSRVYLIGPRGSGKTTVGRQLAAMLGYPFCDLDHLLCAREGCEVADIVARSGWQEFRRIESAVLREASEPSDCIIATGGGIVLSEANRDFLRQNGIAVWLHAPPDVLIKRLLWRQADPQRPSLTGLAPEEEIRQVCAERQPLYAACCHCSVDSSREPAAVCADILHMLKRKL